MQKAIVNDAKVLGIRNTYMFARNTELLELEGASDKKLLEISDFGFELGNDSSDHPHCNLHVKPVYAPPPSSRIIFLVLPNPQVIAVMNHVLLPCADHYLQRIIFLAQIQASSISAT
ncbi:hypothetical protein VIGAN_08180300 [Vigna angularis var. angularis]|uniref:Uncharacterized protein n=1 Tax=Vigna angularis var. angularis TaxID=157739 RepID=A0A0S3SQN4_PHAAN|nr:hypothetical protein VIGAN_08180300 [Vigna angularis var. angularis]